MSAAAGAWGARVGPPFVRRLQDTERPLVLAALLLVTGGLAGGAATTMVWLLASLPWTDGSTWAAVGVIGLLSGGFAVFAAQTATRWPVAALLVAAVTAFVAARLAPLVLRRAAAGGIYLTPDALETRWGVETAIVPWDQVVPMTSSMSPALLLTPGVRVMRSFRVQMPVDVTDHLDETVVQVPRPYLALEVDRIETLLHLGMHRPAARARFGTAESLSWHVDSSYRRY